MREDQVMRLFRKRRGSAGGSGSRSSRSERRESERVLADWVGQRRGVELYVEPKTAFMEVSVVLVAHDGEFTRRTIGSPQNAQRFAKEHSLPIYDATIVGYPQRMRDWSRKQKILAERAEIKDRDRKRS